MRLNHYWMIEYKDWWNNTGWRPTNHGSHTRKQGRKEMKKMRSTCRDKFRLVKYISTNAPNPYEVQIHCDRCGIPCHCGGEPM